MNFRDGIQKVTDAYEGFFDHENGVPRWRHLGETAAIGTGLIAAGVLTGESTPIAFGVTIDGLAVAMAGCRLAIDLGAVNDANAHGNGEN